MKTERGREVWGTMPGIPEDHRRDIRRDHVGRFLSEFAISRGSLAESTRHDLDEWARQYQLVRDQPSANWRLVVVQMCVAVESQLAAGLGAIRGFEFLRKPGPLGPKAWKLKQKQIDQFEERKLVLHGMEASFVKTQLADLMLGLAAVRNPKAHGGAELRSFMSVHGNEVRALAGQILHGIAAMPEGTE